MAVTKRPVVKRVKPGFPSLKKSAKQSLPPSLEPLIKSGADVDGEAIANEEKNDDGRNDK